MASSDDEKQPKWREDFPITWESDHYVTRRELAKFLTLGSGLIAAANGAVAVAGATRRATSYPEVRIGSAASLAPGQSQLFRYPTDDDPCILVRTPHGELMAFSQVCTHLSCAVVYHPGDNKLLCPCHNGAFACEGIGGATPVGGPPERPLARITLSMRGDDVFAIGREG